MEWLEADPLPEECMTSQEEDCYNCDHAGKRWYLAPEDEAKIIQKLTQQAASRQKRISPQ